METTHVMTLTNTYIEMNCNEKIIRLTGAFEGVIGMAIKYANGKQTLDPLNVRVAIETYKEVYPDWSPNPALSILPPRFFSAGGLEEDYLHNLFECKHCGNPDTTYKGYCSKNCYDYDTA